MLMVKSSLIGNYALFNNNKIHDNNLSLGSLFTFFCIYNYVSHPVQIGTEGAEPCTNGTKIKD